MRTRSRFVAGAVAGMLASTTCFGAIGLTLQAVPAQANVGQQVVVDLMALTSSGGPEGLLSFQMIFSWDPLLLRLDGFNGSGGPSYTALGFLRDPYGINNTASITTPPTDGDAVLIGLGPFGSSITVPAGGLRLSRLLFTALAPTPSTPINVLPSAGSPTGTTVVYGAGGPNIDVTGALSGTSVQIIPGPTALCGLLGAGLFSALRRRRV